MLTATPDPTPTSTFKVADPPFDDTDADIILRSSDNVDFYVYKWPLSRASSTLKDMFSIPSTYDSFDADNVKDGLPVVCVTEDRQTLDIVLRLCYPRDQRILTLDVPSIRQLLPALDKYEMLKNFTNILKPLMLTAAETDFYTMYAIACRYQMLNLANRIALLSLKFRSKARFEANFFSEGDLQSITGHHLYQFLLFRERSSSAASRAVRSSWSVHEIPGAFDTDQNPACCCRMTMFVTSSNLQSPFHVPSWILIYFIQCQMALGSRPRCEVVRNPTLVAALIVGAAQCDACRPLISKILLFCAVLKERVQLAIKKVPLPFPEAESKE